MAPILGLVLAAAVQIGSQVSITPGSIVGCISDMVSKRVPGATVIAKGGGVEWSAATDNSGCYEFEELPPASYRVTSRSIGFDNVTRDRLVVRPSAPTRLDITLHVSGMCECIRVTRTLAEHWSRADGVLHVRLSDSEPVASTPQGDYRHAATVLNALKEPKHAGPSSLFVLQNQRNGVPGPFDVGQELVVFLESVGPDAFRIINDGPGVDVFESLAFVVQRGRIQRAPSEFSRYVGMPIAGFLDELRKLSRH
jgi:hypothetical protein